VLALIKDNPAVAARLILAISKRLSDRLREANQNIRMLGGLNISMQQELDTLRSPVDSTPAA
jgi:CRP/FNR family cyclic AMP-dependent transcriptional regulator